MSNAAKQIIGSYELQETLGEGGMGTVYRGIDVLSGQAVAIKQLKSESATPEMIARFSHEAEILRQLNHPNTITMLDILDIGGQPHLIMELVPGGSLHELLQKEQVLSISRLLNIALDLCDALTRAHHLNIVHRDIKPANILLSQDGTPRLTDWISQNTANNNTAAGVIVGTIAYLSPEALDGAEADTRQDIWALGVLLCEMLTGQRPFQGKTSTALISAILTQPLPHLELLRPDTPIGLIDLIYRMLNKNPAERIPSMRLVGAEIEALLQGREATTTSKRFITITSDDDTDTVIDVRCFATTTPTSETYHNLPVQVTPLIGREVELAALAQMLGDSKIRLVTILAPGGMGKTRLSLEAAKQQLPYFRNGVYFVDLAPLNSADNIVSAVAEAVNYTFMSDNREAQQQLLDYFREKEMLLIMDNFEHMLAGRALVETILKVAPDIKILVTSRAGLNQSSEQIFHLHGMEFPEWETPEDALEYSAMKLFMQSAKRVRPDFALQTGDLRYVARICRMVEGLPLGILLAAAWLEMLSLEEIAQEIEKSLDFLQTEMHDIPECQRSIRAVFDYSWNLLTDVEQASLRKLAVLRGGFTREAAQEITQANLRTLQNLVNKSLLRRDPESGRYTMHELLRQYAEERLNAAGELNNTRQVHSRYYLQHLKSAESSIKSSDEKKTLDLELENLRCAWCWAVEQQDWVLVKQTANPVAVFYMARSWLKEGAELFANAATAVQKGLNAETEMLYWILITRKHWFTAMMGQYEENKVETLQALAFFRKCDVQAEVLLCLNNLCSVQMMQGNYPDARRYGEEAITVAKTINIPIMTIRAIANLGYVAFLEGNYEEAHQLYEEAKPLAEQTRSMVTLTMLYNNIAEILHAMGQEKQAKDYFNQSLTIARELDNQRAVATALNNLGKIAHVLAEHEEARVYNQESYELYHKIGDRRGIGDALNRLGGVAYSTGSYEQAIAYHQQAQQLYREMGDRRGIADSLVLEGIALSRIGKLDESDIVLNEALRSRREIGNLVEIADVLQYHALNAQYRGDFETATRLNEESFVLIQQTGGVNAQTLNKYRVFKGIFGIFSGDFETAKEGFQQILANEQDMDLCYLTETYTGLGFANYGLHNMAQAQKYFYRSLKLAIENQIMSWSAFAVLGLGLVIAEDRGNRERGVELITLCLAQPDLDAFMVILGEEQLKDLKRHTGDERFEAAQDRGRKLDLMQIVTELLKEFKPAETS